MWGDCLDRRTLVRAFLVGSVCIGLALPAGALELLGTEILPGDQRRLTLMTSESFAGASVSTPITVVSGIRPGRTLCLTAGIHGDELIGVEVVRRAVEELDAQTLTGSVIAIPIVNPHGFRRSSRYLPDRRDLNRFFPGRAYGSAASRIAFRVFDGVIKHCGLLIDFHTGSFHRTNVAQLRADVRDPAIAVFAKQFGTPVVVHSAGQPGTMRRAAVDIGIPAITYEAGEPMRFEVSEIEAGVAGIHRLMVSLGMVEGPATDVPDQRTYYRSRWVRVDEGGILLTSVQLGERVERGAALGTVIDPISNHRSVVRSPYRGTIVGMALNQVVIPGFAAYHVGIAGGSPSGQDEGYPDAGSSEDLEPQELQDHDVRPEE